MAGLVDLVNAAGATPVGAGVAVERRSSPAARFLRSRGIRIESLARIKVIGKDGIEFC